MKESAQAALSYARSRAAALGIDGEDYFGRTDIHIHVPEGAIPKDGPSAGITMATAMLSAFLGKKVRRDVAMTGEITLRGNVLPVGGIKEKVLAARRANIKLVIMPRANERNLVDIPETLRRDVEFLFVDSVEQVFDCALVNFAGAARRPGKKTASEKRSSRRRTAAARM